jgi:hypothetical protein
MKGTMGTWRSPHTWCWLLYLCWCCLSRICLHCSTLCCSKWCWRHCCWHLQWLLTSSLFSQGLVCHLWPRIWSWTSITWYGVILEFICRYGVLRFSVFSIWGQKSQKKVILFDMGFFFWTLLSDMGSKSFCVLIWDDIGIIIFDMGSAFLRGLCMFSTWG